MARGKRELLAPKELFYPKAAASPHSLRSLSKRTADTILPHQPRTVNSCSTAWEKEPFLSRFLKDKTERAQGRGGGRRSALEGGRTDGQTRGANAGQTSARTRSKRQSLITHAVQVEKRQPLGQGQPADYRASRY